MYIEQKLYLHALINNNKRRLSPNMQPSTALFVRQLPWNKLINFKTARELSTILLSRSNEAVNRLFSSQNALITKHTVYIIITYIISQCNVSRYAKLRLNFTILSISPGLDAFFLFVYHR